MYRGYLRVGNTELINVARTMAYVGAGYHPPDTQIDAGVAYDSLAEALGDTYQTPVLDAAPWYDVARPETHGFAGVLPIDITGLSGSTAAREVVESIGDGGVAQQVRRSTRTIAVTALLVGDSDASAYAGLEWLTTTLLQSCEDTTYGTTIEGYLTQPVGGDIEDLDAALVGTEVAPDADGWRGYGGNWHPDSEEFVVEATADPQVIEGVADGGYPWTLEPESDLDGGTPDASGDPEVDGDTPGPGTDGGGASASVFTASMDGGGITDTYTEAVDGGTLTRPPSPPYARLAPPVTLGCVSEVVVTWVLTPLPGAAAARIQVGAVDSLGRELWREATQTITEETTITWEWQNAVWDDWSPAIWSADPGVEVQVTVAQRPLLDPAACRAGLLRQFTQVSLVAAPNVTGEWADDCDNKLLQVEWTWSCGNPYRFTAATTLVQGVSATSDSEPTEHADGVNHAYLGTVTATDTACPAPTTTPVTCAYDPLGLSFVAPPAAPVIPDPGAVTPTGYSRSVISLDPGVIPANSVQSLIFYLTNDGTAKRGIRVRLWQHDDPDATTLDECAFTHEFWVNYLDNDSFMTIASPTQDALVICDGSVARAESVLRGPYKGTFQWPTMDCGGRWFVAVDVPTGTGTLDWELLMFGREG